MFKKNLKVIIIFLILLILLIITYLLFWNPNNIVVLLNSSNNYRANIIKKSIANNLPSLNTKIIYKFSSKETEQQKQLNKYLSQAKVLVIDPITKDFGNILEQKLTKQKVIFINHLPLKKNETSINHYFINPNYQELGYLEAIYISSTFTTPVVATLSRNVNDVITRFFRQAVINTFSNIQLTHNDIGFSDKYIVNKTIESWFLSKNKPNVIVSQNTIMANLSAQFIKNMNKDVNIIAVGLDKTILDNISHNLIHATIYPNYDAVGEYITKAIKQMNNKNKKNKLIDNVTFLPLFIIDKTNYKQYITN